MQATVHASGLGGHEYVRVKVLKVNGSAVDTSDPPVFVGTEGPQDNGEVDTKLTLPLPSGSYTGLLLKAWQTAKEPPCDITKIGGKGTFGCVFVAVPRPTTGS
jgi:hypothetical protein